MNIRKQLGKRAYFASAIAVLAMIATACGGGTSTADSEAVEITYGHPVASLNASTAPLGVAKELGFFADEGLTVNVQPTDGSLKVVQSVITGQFDIGLALPDAIVPAIADGNDLRMFYNHYRGPTGSIAVLADSSIKSIADLKGTTLGAASLGSGNIALTNAMLKKAGLNPKKDVKYVAVGFGAQALQAIQSKKVDALVLFDELYAGMENLGAKFRYFRPASYLFSSQMVARQKTIDKQPDVIKKFGRAMAKATYFTRANPEAAIRALWSAFPETRSPGVSEDKQMAADLRVLNKRLEALLSTLPKENGWGEYDPAAVSKWIDYAVDAGLLDSQIDPKSVYTNEFVKSYNNWDPADVEALAND